MLYCPNYTCQTPNPETHKFCQKCRTLLPRHYLWAVGDGVSAYRSEDILANRYLCKSSRIFLDTKPGLYPTLPTEVPQEFVPYLRLSPYQLHVPQVYEVLSSSTTQLLLLDQAAFSIPSLPTAVEASALPEGIDPQLLPALVDGWQEASALRQLNWLWQIAQLWQPLSSQQVVSSLFAPELIRVEGSLVRLLELRADQTEPLTLEHLGHYWASWATTARPEITKPLSQLCQDLEQGQIRNDEQLIGRLDELLMETGRSPSRQIQLITRTDKGPSRQRNEDACYPPSGALKKAGDGSQWVNSTEPILVIVCDGIGGHQGGDVASNLAIEAVRQQVQPVQPDQMDVPSLTVALERAVCAANDLISQRNDSEQRFDRQRMGTTLVMGLVRAHELYITHVGDSRAYWITRHGCHQITQDDDVASREVRLGYSPYREALQQPSAGSLIQALGMGSSTSLRPTVQRFVPDEDSIFLLCSDGLSDNDRVEEYWETTLLPLLEGKADLGTVSQQLIDIANTRNGHDNVTIGLLYIRVRDPQWEGARQEELKEAIAPSPTPSPPTLIQTNQDTAIQHDFGALPEPSPLAETDLDTVKTHILPPRRQKNSNVLLLLGILVLLGGGGVLMYSLSLAFRERVDTLFGRTPLPPPTSPSPSSLATASPLPDPPTPIVALQAGTFIQVNPDLTTTTTPVILVPQPESSLPSIEGGAIPSGSILQVLQKQGTTQQERWVQLRVCSVAENAPPNTGQGVNPQSAPTSVRPPYLTASPPSLTDPAASPSPATLQTWEVLQPGATGWIQETQILPLVLPKPTPTLADREMCLDDLPPPGNVNPSDLS